MVIIKESKVYLYNIEFQLIDSLRKESDVIISSNGKFKGRIYTYGDGTVCIGFLPEGDQEAKCDKFLKRTPTQLELPSGDVVKISKMKLFYDSDDEQPTLWSEQYLKNHPERISDYLEQVEIVKYNDTYFLRLVEYSEDDMVTPILIWKEQEMQVYDTYNSEMMRVPLKL